MASESYVFPARFDSICHECGGEVSAGDLLEAIPGQYGHKKQYRHAGNCPATAPSWDSPSRELDKLQDLCRTCFCTKPCLCD